jgi:hypothetical protein
MSLSQKWGPHVLYHANGKRFESFSHEAFASMPLTESQATIFAHEDTFREQSH